MKTLLAFIALIACLVMAQAPASGYPPGYIGPYTRLGAVGAGDLLDGGPQLQGALVFIRDAGVPYFYDGTSWQSFGGGGTDDAYWVDGGSGRVNLRGVSVAGPSAGPFIVQPNNSSTNLSTAAVVSGQNFVGGANGLTALSFMGPNVTSPSIFNAWGNIFTSQGTSANMHAGLILHAHNGGGETSHSFVTGNISAWPVTTTNGNLMARIAPAANGFALGGATGNGGSVLSYATSGNIAFGALRNGARFDLGDGTNDYFASNGTGIEAASYVRVGNYNDAGLPLATSIAGGIAYNTSQGQPVYSDGTAWQSFGGGGNYWADAGFLSNGGVRPASGTGAAMRTSAYVIDQTNAEKALWLIGKSTALTFPIADPALTLYSEVGHAAIKFSQGFQFNNSGSAYVFYSAADSPGSGFGFGLNLKSNSIVFTENGTTERFGRFDSSTNGFVASTPSGSNAWANDTNGARIDLGTGASDYCASDGTGIETPSYWESTRALTTGPGVIANAATLTSNSTLSYDSTLSSTYAAGSIATDDVRGTVIRRFDYSLPDGGLTVGAFSPIAPHIVFDEQTFTTRVVGKELNSPPKFAEFVPTSIAGSPDGGGTYLDMYWTDADNTTQLLGNRLWYYIETTGASGNQQYGQSTDSSIGTFDGTAFQRITSSDLSPSMCQRVYTGANVTDTRHWVGMGAGTLAAGTSTMSQNGVFFRYDPTVDTDWQLCTKDGVTQSCAKTTVVVTASTEYTLCAKLDAARTAYGYINGNFVARKTSNRVPADTALGPFVSVEAQAVAVKRLYIGVMQIGTR